MRSNPLHTLLSTLGIVIGIAALVAILALGDGMEKFGREQIETTTSLQMIFIRSVQRDQVDGIWLRRDSVKLLTPGIASGLRQLLGEDGTVSMYSTLSDRFELESDTIESVALIRAQWLDGDLPQEGILAGTMLTPDPESADEIVLGSVMANRFAPDGDIKALIGAHVVRSDGVVFQIAAVLDQPDETPRVMIPLSALDRQDLNDYPPEIIVEVRDVTDVQVIRDEIADWLSDQWGFAASDLEIVTNEHRLAQVSRGIALFKLVMGLITGISVLVGGIGIMNVLLMSVSERTREIGIRKAAGAKRPDIAFQFMIESLALSLVGCFLGLIIGLAAVFVLTPIIRAVTEVPFHAAFQIETLGIIAIVGLFVGMVFGVYPAWRAARLEPVEAIRRE